MSVPGSNLLNSAMRVIAPQKVKYFKFLSRESNDIGLYVSQFAEPRVIIGSLQPVPRNRYEALGLDFNRNYVTLYASKNIFDVDRDIAGDQIEYCGQRFECESCNDWFAIDGWLSVVCVQIPTEAPEAPDA